MDTDKLVGLNHDVFCGACDAYDLLMLLVKLKSNWLYATIFAKISLCNLSFL